MLPLIEFLAKFLLLVGPDSGKSFKFIQVFEYAFFSPNSILMQCFCALKSCRNLTCEISPHTVIPYARWLSYRVWYRLLWKFLGIRSIIWFNWPALHLILLWSIVIWDSHESWMSIMTPKNLVSLTSSISCTWPKYYLS